MLKFRRFFIIMQASSLKDQPRPALLLFSDTPHTLMIFPNLLMRAKAPRSLFMNPLTRSVLILGLLASTLTAAPDAKPGTLPEAKRIVFLGDSITHSGQYIQFIETVLLAETGKRYDILNLGLSSETVSGLSEEGHAGGQFPRPDLHERLDRVLAKTKPDLVVACYGMNDGIYLPLDAGRFQKYKDGIQKLRDKAQAMGAHVIHITPPVYDPVPVKGKYPYYNEVLGAYGKWLLSKRAEGWRVIDIHGPMNEALAQKRKTDAAFAFQKDGVHPNDEGHWVMAQQVLAAWGVKHDYVLADFTSGRLATLHKLVVARQHARNESWLNACGHKRPGVGKGLPLDEAEAKAAEFTTKIDAMLKEVTSKVGGGEEIRRAAPANASAPSTPSLFPGKLGKWHDFDSYTFEVDGKEVTVVAPKEAAKGKPWCWHGEFFGHKPDPDIALLGKGFHIVYMKINDMLGSPPAVKHWDALYNELTKKYGFSKKPALVGLSRGGLYVYNWAIANPGKVSCIYGDAPVCDFKSWPGGKGKGKGDKHNWELVMKLWGFKDEAEALAYKGNPVDSLAALAAHHVPLLHVYGDADDVVPPDENTLVIAERYRKLGGNIDLIAKAGVGHHPHGLQDSTPIVEFILKHAK